MKLKLPRRSDRKYLNPVIFHGPEGLVHFINTAGLHEKRHPTTVKLFEIASGKVIVEDEDGTIIGQFFGKNWRGGA